MILLVLVVVLLDSPLHSWVVELFEFQQAVCAFSTVWASGAVLAGVAVCSSTTNWG